MERPSASRLPAPAVKAPALAAKRGSGGGGPTPFGFRRPSASSVASPLMGPTPAVASASTRRRSSREGATPQTPPRLALHELQQHGGASGSPQPTTTAVFLRRGSGRTIATLGNPSVGMTPPPSSTRRTSGGSPRVAPAMNGQGAVRAGHATPLRSRHGPRDAALAGELLTANKMRVKSYNETTPANMNGQLAVHPQQQYQEQQQQLTVLSPETSFRQRKRSADMMDPHESPVMKSTVRSEPTTDPDEVDEPPMMIANGQNVAAPMTPPPRTSSGELVPLSPRDPKRAKRLTRSPKTPLGLSTYESEEGGLSATQRVRLSLSGYMTVASLTGVGSVAKSGRRESGAGGSADTDLLIANGAAHEAAPSSTPTSAPRQSPTRLNQSSRSSLARSKFGASRSMSGTQIASALLPSKNSVDCLMGYIRELQRSEAMLRKQVEQDKKQRRGEHSRSTVRENELEMTIKQVESEREHDRRQLEEQARLIDELKAEMAKLHDVMAGQQPHIISNEATPPSEGSYYQQDPQQWANANDVVLSHDGHGQATANGHPSSAYVTPPPSGSGGRYSRVRQQSSTTEQVGSEPTSSSDMIRNPALDSQSAEWNGGQGAYYQTDAYYSHQHGSTTARFEGYQQTGEWPDANAGYYGEGQYQHQDQQDSTSTPAYSTANQHGEYGGHDHHPNSEEVYNGEPGEYFPSAVPMSPVAKLDPTRSPLDAKSVQPQIESPPPMFRVAPRLSDIIAPLSRSVIAAPVTADHNVLKPVTPQALTNARHARTGEIVQTMADQEFMMTPPPLGPPAFSMSGFQSSSDRESTPPPSNPKRQVNTPAIPVPGIPDHTSPEEKQFVPAEQVFKPFQKAKTPTRKTSMAGDGNHVPRETLKTLLIEFLMAVDKPKVKMADGYSRRYQGEEGKLFDALTKRYGEKKVAELKKKFEVAMKPLVPSDVLVDEVMYTNSPAPQQSEDELASSAHFPGYASASDAAVAAVRAMDSSPKPVNAGDPGVKPAIESTFQCQSTFERFEQYHAQELPQEQRQPTGVDERLGEGSALANNLVSQPPFESMDLSQALQTAPSPRKMSPKSLRRGPPLPFGFDDAEQPTPEHATSKLLPPPVPHVSVAPPPTTIPLPSPLSPAATAASSASRLAPSPPRIPPPPERSPARNASVLRQRLPPQRPQATQSSIGAPPLASPPPFSSGAMPSPPKNSTTPVTLESLLLEFYRKHQPDRVKNVPEVVRQYTGKERDLIADLKRKYGALSIKRLEQNFDILVKQSSPASSSKAARTSSGTEKNSNKQKSRSCFGRLMFLLIKLILVRVAVTTILLGGLVALDHSHCMSEDGGDDVEKIAPGDCQVLAKDVASFQMSQIMDYVTRIESRKCFCEQWRQRELDLSDGPSVAGAVDLLKLVPFSRTIAEPAWLQFVDKYLPDLPYSEYYRSYAEPAFLVGKEYAVVGVTHVREAISELMTNTRDMPWQEIYEAHGKRLVTKGWEQWDLLVTMYNEEVTADTSSSAPPVIDESKITVSSADVLTKVAMASKALAESNDIEEKDVSPADDGDVKPSDPVGAAEHVAIDHEVDTSVLTDVPVEVSVEQTGLDLSYNGVVNTDHGIDTTGLEDTTLTSSAEDIEPFGSHDASFHQAVVDEETSRKTSNVHEIPSQDFQPVESELVEGSVAVVEEPVVEVEDDEVIGDERAQTSEMEAHDSAKLDGSTEDRREEAEVNGVEHVVDEGGHTPGITAHDSLEIPELNEETEAEGQVEERIQADELAAAQELDASDAQLEANSVVEDTSPPAESEGDDAEVRMSELTKNEEYQPEPGSESVVDTHAGTQEWTAEEIENGNVVAADDEHSVSSVEDSGRLVVDDGLDFESDEVAVVEADQTTSTDHFRDESTRSDQEEKEAARAESSADESTVNHADQTSDEELDFLDDTEGLDLLELLDLADLAAAELHSMD